MNVPPGEFAAIVAEAVDAIPEQVREKLEHVVFLAEDAPRPDQQEDLGVGADELLGLFEGPTRGEERTIGSHLPATITVYRLAHEAETGTYDELVAEVRDTVWHEVAHYLGLDEDDVRHEEEKSER